MSRQVYFSDVFGLNRQVIEAYGAINISLIRDLPLFIDPFRLFNSNKAEYIKLHDEMIAYVKFLKSVSNQQLSTKEFQSLFYFPEVCQNWFGYCRYGNKGNALKAKFANSIKDKFIRIDAFRNFGEEKDTGSHIEKLCLMGDNIGRDRISDFCVNLIKRYLLEYTEEFAKNHLSRPLIKEFTVEKAWFDYDSKQWQPATYLLPSFKDDFVLLTPRDIVAKDRTWICDEDMVERLDDVIDSMPNGVLRDKLNQYLALQLFTEADKQPTKKQRKQAVKSMVEQFPEFIDWYIRYKEVKRDSIRDTVDRTERSLERYIDDYSQLLDSLDESGFYSQLEANYDSELIKALIFKEVIENKKGYKYLYTRGVPISTQEDLDILHRFIWFAHSSENDSIVKPIVQMKLASNNQLKPLLNKASSSSERKIWIVLCFNEADITRVDIITSLLGSNLDTVVVKAY